MSIKAIVALIVAAILAAGLWFGGHGLYNAGYAARDAIAVSAQLKQANQAIELGTQNIKDARATDIALIAKGAAALKVSQARASRLDQALKRTEAIPFIPTSISKEHPYAVPPLLAQSVLDAFTLCLLNAERSESAVKPSDVCAPERTDAEVRTAAETRTDVRGSDLARSDLEAVRRFNELAARHNGLVDWVDLKIIQGK